MASQSDFLTSQGRSTGLATDVCVVGTELYLLPVQTRMPLKFGAETLTSVTCARVRIVVQDRNGKTAVGWGETPLNVQWAWPSDLGYSERHEAMVDFCRGLTEAWTDLDEWGHPLEIGQAFIDDALPNLNRNSNSGHALPLLATLVCCSPFDLAVHDAYGNLLGMPVYETYTERYMNRDVSAYLAPVEGSDVDFHGKYPSDYLETNYLITESAKTLPAWHLVGGLDPLAPEELNGHIPSDGHPVLLDRWISRDGLTCLKIKLRGNDPEWDFQRIVQVAKIGIEHSVRWLSADFNCTVTNPSYVNDILDRLAAEHPESLSMMLYVEQPFPYDLNKHRIDVHSVSARKPLFMDESAHDWEHVKLGHSLGWTGVALKTCKTQTGAILSLCWAKAHRMQIMVQDLTNPMLAQIPHVLLAAHSGTIKGVETNAMQFYPDASLAEAAVHPGLYKRRNGQVDLSSIRGSGFGYRIDEIARTLPEPAISCGANHFVGKE